jgi:PAS domain S-box-containing protein
LANQFLFEKQQFNRLFPFYILINQRLDVVDYGQTLQKVLPGKNNLPFTDCCVIKRPADIGVSFNALKNIAGHQVIIECLNEKRIKLRGQIEFLQDSNELLFLGSPWFGSIEEVLENNLSLDDFAYHDPMIDLLHVLKTQEITSDDLKQVLKTVNKQKNELKKANKEIHDIALFPQQNPDPLIRINFEGEVLSNNPAAETLKEIEFENIVYDYKEFYRLIAKKIDTSNQRWTYEAKSNNRLFSFVCKTIIESGYVNIYGRDITEAQKNLEELNRLSYIVQQTPNPIVITDAAGKIEWVNKGFKNNTGYTLDEVKGKTPGSVLQGPETDNNTRLYIREKVSNAQPFTCEIYNYKKNGEGYWLRINSQPIFDKDGNLIQFFAIEEDITKEKEADKKLKEFDKRLNLALQKMGDNVWEHDFITKQTNFSQKEFELLGYSTEDFNNNVDLWYACVHPEDKKKLKENDVLYRRGIIDHHSLEYRIIDKSGKTKWVLDRGVVIEKNSNNLPLRIIGTHTDITAKKSIEKEVEASASRMSSLITNLQAGVLLENENKQITLVNTRFCELFGINHNPSALVGESCTTASQNAKHLFKDSEAFIKDISKIYEHKILVTSDKLELIDGRTFIRDFIPIWNQGVFVGCLWVYNDITEKLTAEKKLEDQRVFYEEILDNIPSDIAVFDHEHRYLYLNPKAIKDAELRKWMIGKKDEDYIELRKLPQSILESRRAVFNTVAESKELKSWEEERKLPDGSKVYILRNMYPVLDKKGEVKIVIGYGIDITDIKNIQQKIELSEKSYRDVIDNSMAIITTHDLDGKFLTVNPMVGKLYGFTDEEMIGHGIDEFMLPEDKELFKTVYLNTIKDEKQASGILRVVNKNGGIIYTLYNNFLKEEPGKPPYIIGFSVDITDRVLAEKELRKAKKITEELAKTKQNFLANMSHEIRTPMNAIMGMANQLGKTQLNSTQQFYLNTINSASDNLLVIINDILDLSKIEAGKLSFENIGFEPHLFVLNAMQVLANKADEKGLQLTNSYFDNSVSKVLIGDPYRLNQVMLNLISNAIKFTEKGGIDVTLTVLNDTSESQLIKIAITDTGIGMEEEFVQRLFDKFSQEYESVSRKYGGTGLGMSICKDLIELMGGKIYATSKKGVGTTITFELMLNKGTNADLKTKEVVEFKKDFLANKKILIVDDNDMNRLVASIILENYGTQIFEAVNGAEAIEKVNSIQPDLVLMDLQMPLVNGFEATETIRKQGNKLPIIALTANAIKGENDKCFVSGMNDYVPKPFKEEDLLKVIAKWLGTEITTTLQTVETNITMPNTNDELLYDLTSLNTISGGNEVFIKKMLSIFCDQTPQMVQEMQQAFSANDYDTMGALAHKIKPSIDNLAINSLKQVVRDIEAVGKGKTAVDNLPDLLQLCNDVVVKVVEQMRNKYLDL